VQAPLFIAKCTVYCCPNYFPGPLIPPPLVTCTTFLLPSLHFTNVALFRATFLYSFPWLLHATSGSYPSVYLTMFYVCGSLILLLVRISSTMEVETVRSTKTPVIVLFHLHYLAT
jgi:hypothetical protein